MKPRSDISIFCMGRNARQIFTDLGYAASKDMDPAEADIVWVRDNFEQRMFELSDNQALNHVPNEECLNHKGLMAELSRGRADWVNFHPDSYCLYIYDHTREFFSKPRDGIWLAKPGSASRGVGIKLFRPAADTTGLRFNAEDYIFQKYVENPFLLNGLKSSIRCYWLIAGLDPLMVYLYPEGTVKLCTDKYTTDNLDQLSCHLTNTFQNKSAENYNAEENKLSWVDFFNRSPELNGDAIVASMTSAIATIIETAHDILVKRPQQGHFFALLAADWVLDENSNLWLTEVQQSFGVRFDDPLKKRILPELFDETIQVVNEIVKERTTEPEAVKKFVRVR